jgi:endogenous inhibitor of DNA gyrase (YacG/DUF329 family)
MAERGLMGAARRLHYIGAMPERAPTLRLKPCPICGKLAIEQFRPFCSKRCADIDLHRWLAGVYAVPVVEDEERAKDDESSDEPRG